MEIRYIRTMTEWELIIPVNLIFLRPNEDQKIWSIHLNLEILKIILEIIRKINSSKIVQRIFTLKKIHININRLISSR
jgi:hypothetical protein